MYSTPATDWSKGTGPKSFNGVHSIKAIPHVYWRAGRGTCHSFCRAMPKNKVSFCSSCSAYPQRD